MKRLIEVTAEIFFDVLSNIRYFIKNNLVNIADTVELIIPFMMFFIGQDVSLREGKLSITWELILPVLFFVLVFYLKSIANKIGKGITIPVPQKRFTQVDDDGEVSIENKRIQELILYLADLEDWFERKGYYK